MGFLFIFDSLVLAGTLSLLFLPLLLMNFYGEANVRVGIVSGVRGVLGYSDGC